LFGMVENCDRIGESGQNESKW